MSYDIFVNALEDLIARAERGDFEVEDQADEIERIDRSFPDFTANVQIDPPQRAKDIPDPPLTSIKSSSFNNLLGCSNQVVQHSILPYLSSSEVGTMSLTCKFFRHLCFQPSLWDYMYNRDFVPPGTGAISRSGMVEQRNAALLVSSDPRNMYLQRYRAYLRRLSQSKDDAKTLEREIVRTLWAGRMERLLDLTQLRLPGPILLCSLFLSITLYCQKVDGLDIPYWSCAVPLAFSCLYLLASFCLVALVEWREFNPNSFFKGLWPHTRGPIVSLYQALDRKPRLLKVLGGMVLLFLVQIGLLVAKLSLYVPESFRDDLTWGMVFIPTWMFFFLFLMLHWIGFRLELAVYIAAFFLLWIPFVSLFVCLTVKLDYNNNGKGNIRMAYVLIPFFLFEGIFMLWTVVAFVVAVIRYRRGFLEGVGQYALLALFCWGTLGPLVCFQALICARDDNQLQNHHSFPSATEVVSPFLILLGWIAVIGTIASFSHQTAFETRRANVVTEAAGLRIIHHF